MVQLYAYDELGQDIIAHQAHPKQKYSCRECHREVRVRSGPFIRAHFFHLQNVSPCRLREKSPTHLEIQDKLLKLLPPGEVVLEKRFSTLKRIADVVWEKEKLIFEIQVSFITAAEVQARSLDYRSLSYEIVWILHDTRFNTFRITAAEQALLDFPHYFTNINAQGQGSFYDQFSYHLGGTRAARLFSRPIDITHPIRQFSLPPLPPKIIQHRQNWKISFQGDLFNSTGYLPRHVEKAHELETFLKRPPLRFSLRKKIKDAFRMVGYLIMDAATR